MKLKDIIIVTSNYHVKKVRKIYKHILGSNYSIGFVGVKTELCNDPETIAREERSLNKFLEQFGKLKPGDSVGIEQILYNQHPLYKKIPDEKRLRFY